MNYEFRQYRIRRADRRNLIIERLAEVRPRGMHHSESEWVFSSYHPNLRQALLRMVDLLPTSETATAQDLLEEIEALREWIEEVITPEMTKLVG